MACNIKTVTRACGTALLTGTEDFIYLIPQAEVETFPAVVGTTDPGDSKTLDEAWDLVATVGLGYWRKIPVLIDTGQQTNTMEGQVGGRMIRQRAIGFIPGNDATIVELIDNLLKCDGCLLAMTPNKDGNLHVLGDLNNGVYLEVIEGGSGGDRVGYNFTLQANTGTTTFIYPVTLGVDITPNPTP